MQSCAPLLPAGMSTSTGSLFYSDRPRFPSGGGIGRIMKKHDTEYDVNHLNQTPKLTKRVLSQNEWLVMPQGGSASPSWFVKVMNEVIKGLQQVAAYLDDMIVFNI